ncbi:MAG: hypothetical protein ACTHMC_11160 [Pseudobacter sp.]|uniref:hypothetical protein n=1 Tax=Pseudobacter sp. TaxID=2045420 RepID=UPI003F7CF88A
MQPLSWREKFAGIFILVLGLIFMILFVMELFTSRSSDVTSNADAITVNRAALFRHIRNITSILIAIAGALGLLRQKQLGWMLAVPFLLIIGVIAGYFLYLTLTTGMGMMSIAPGIALLLVIMSLIFLLLPSAREKYRVSSKTILPTLVFLLAIGAVFFLLQ